jgi:hypothetical protein
MMSFQGVPQAHTGFQSYLRKLSSFRDPPLPSAPE